MQSRPDTEHNARANWTVRPNRLLYCPLSCVIINWFISLQLLFDL